jgi:hypothetical protein
MRQIQPKEIVNRIGMLTRLNQKLGADRVVTPFSVERCQAG